MFSKKKVLMFIRFGKLFFFFSQKIFFLLYFVHLTACQRQNYAFLENRVSVIKFCHADLLGEFCLYCLSPNKPVPSSCQWDSFDVI